MKRANTVRINLLFLVLICFLFAIIIGKTIYISLDKINVGNVSVSEFAKTRNTVKKTLYATRGNIYDSLGEVLAQNVNSYTVIAYLASSRTTDINNPRHVIDSKTTASKLAPILNMSEESILKLLNTEKAYQVELGPGGRNITELIKEQIEALELPGIGFTKSTKRYYKMGDFASYIVGYAKTNDTGEIIGELGIEKTYNTELKGIDGYTEYQKDAYGYQISGTPSTETKSTQGYDIYLTIDNQIQMLVENAINDLENELDYTWLGIHIADAKTGAVLATSSSPSFDPNKLNITSYLTPLTQYAYEPGSTMKIFTYMASMEKGLYNGSDTFKSGSFEVSDTTINDFNKTGWGIITYDQGFLNSSNVAASKLALQLGRKSLKSYFESFGFGSKTGIELNNEYTGKINFTYDIETATAGYGQGITVTPIQNLKGMTIISNKGTLLEPYIISKIVDPNTGNIVYEGKRTEIGKVVSESTVEKITELLYDSVHSGITSAKGYGSKTVSVMGKSGTAQIPSADGGYLTGKTNYIYSFLGMFPSEDPQYIIYVSVKQLEQSLTKVQKKVVGIIEDIAQYKNLNESNISIENKTIKLSNYINLSKESVLKELNSLNLTPITLGDGLTIINQYPNKSFTVLNNSKIFLLTNDINYKLPNIIGWSSNEIISFCNFINLPYTINGYGKVVKASLNEGDIIDIKTKLEIELG